jgi:hypothetical protein
VSAFFGLEDSAYAILSNFEYQVPGIISIMNGLLGKAPKKKKKKKKKKKGNP